MGPSGLRVHKRLLLRPAVALQMGLLSNLYTPLAGHKCHQLSFAEADKLAGDASIFWSASAAAPLQVAPSTALAPAKLVVQASLGKLALLISNDRHDENLPILEAAICNLLAEGQMQSDMTQLSSLAHLQLLVDIHNSSKGMWEPLVEPWQCSVGFSKPGTRCATPEAGVV